MSIACKWASERFPWLLNGSLEDDVEQRLLRHVADCERCRSELREAHLAAEIFAVHPPAHDLALVVFGADPLDLDRELVLQHVNECPHCRSEVEMIQAESAATGQSLDQPLQLPELPLGPLTALFDTRAQRFLPLAAVLALAIGVVVVGKDAGRSPAPAVPPAAEHAARIAEQSFEEGLRSLGSAVGRVEVISSNGFETGSFENWPGERHGIESTVEPVTVSSDPL